MEDPLQQNPTLPAQPGGSGCLKVFAIGCGLLIILAIIAGITVAIYFDDFIAWSIRNVVVAAVEDSELPEDQKQAIIGEVDELITDFQEGRITGEDLTRVLEELAQGPLMAMGVLFVVEQQYLAQSGLSPEEKDAARLDLQRFGRGMLEGNLDQDDLKEVMASLEDDSGQLKNKLSDEELRKALADVKTRVDAAGISSEPYEIDVAAEVKRAIDEGLNR